jgi:hypothetical protein
MQGLFSSALATASTLLARSLVHLPIVDQDIRLCAGSRKRPNGRDEVHRHVLHQKLARVSESHLALEACQGPEDGTGLPKAAQDGQDGQDEYCVFQNCNGS